jgi:hypothetical protein
MKLSQIFVALGLLLGLAVVPACRDRECGKPCPPKKVKMCPVMEPCPEKKCKKTCQEELDELKGQGRRSRNSDEGK